MIPNHQLCMKSHKPHVIAVLHMSACDGTLKDVPAELLTVANLTLRDVFGRTPLHLAASSGHLAQIPSEILTPVNLTEPDNDGNTPLSLAVKSMDSDRWLQLWITFSAEQQEQWRKAFETDPSLNDALAKVMHVEQHAASQKAWE
jgi:hypothetical protein